MAEKENLTKSYIYKAFLQILEKKHFDNISVCEIAEKAGVSRMSFYRNFASKDDIIFKGFDEIFKRIHQKIRIEQTKTQYAIAKSIFEEFRFAKNIIHSLENTSLDQLITTQITEKISENLPSDCMSKTSKYIPIFCIGAIASTLIAWLKNGAEEEPEDMAKLIASLLDGV